MQHKFKEVIEGTFVYLKKITEDDAQDIYTWRSGMSGKFLRQPTNYSVEAQKNWIKSRSEKEINYIIVDKITGGKTGTIGIYDVNEDDKIANAGRLLLSETWLSKSNPYGLEAMLLCYDYVFNVMNFRKITGDILAVNVAMFKLQNYLGMKQEGYLEKHVLINGDYLDLHVMSIFKDDFNSSYKKKIQFLLKAFNK